jgi:hypothetical protein
MPETGSVPDADAHLTVADVLRSTRLSEHLPSLPDGTAALLRDWVAPRQVSSTSWVHLERHWYPSTDRTDLIVSCDAASAAGGTLWTPPISPNPSQAQAFAALQAALPTWRALAMESVAQIGRCWLEFDAPESPLTSVPGCFFDAVSHTGIRAPVVASLMTSLASPALRARLTALHTSLEQASESFRIMSVGWLPRQAEHETVRICVAGPLRPLLRQVLGAAEDAGMQAQLAALHAPLPLASPLYGLVHLDVAKHAIATVGIELMMRKAPQLTGVLLERPFLIMLAAMGFCPPSELAWLADFPGAVPCGRDGRRIAVRRISHLKLVYREGALHRVKCYVAVGLLSRSLAPRH